VRYLRRRVEKALVRRADWLRALAARQTAALRGLPRACLRACLPAGYFLRGELPSPPSPGKCEGQVGVDTASAAAACSARAPAAEEKQRKEKLPQTPETLPPPQQQPCQAYSGDGSTIDTFGRPRLVLGASAAANAAAAAATAAAEAEAEAVRARVEVWEQVLVVRRSTSGEVRV